MSTCFAKTVPVLMYHHVTPEGGVLNCTPKNFEAQMAYLANRGYTTLTSQQFARFMQGEPVPERSVLITFDDGYLDNYVYAHPILKKYELNALMFLMTSWVHDEVARPSQDSSQAYPFCPPHEECKHRLTNARIDDVIVRWEEVRLMEQNKTFEFHSHSHTHTRWDKQLNREGKNAAFLHELQQTKEIFIEQLGRVGNHFCWPQGYYDQDYLRIAQEQGFKYFYTTDNKGINVPKESAENATHIYRHWMGNIGALGFSCKLWLLRHPRIGKWFKSLGKKKQHRVEEKIIANQVLN